MQFEKKNLLESDFQENCINKMAFKIKWHLENQSLQFFFKYQFFFHQNMFSI
jgi:hypothetical protein